MIYIIDDDEVMARCLARACGEAETAVYSNAYDAMSALDEHLPDLILLDVLLDGPDGFTFLHELVSYKDTADIPVVIITSLDVAKSDLSAYGVVGVLSKDEMTPQDIRGYVVKYVNRRE